ncbi:hypothetical protein J6590_050350 [Homalodisca vitripennis]|nr:hypothetical protein J6590_050350 [Homalodisca vitripennis]
MITGALEKRVGAVIVSSDHGIQVIPTTQDTNTTLPPLQCCAWCEVAPSARTARACRSRHTFPTKATVRPLLSAGRRAVPVPCRAVLCRYRAHHIPEVRFKTTTADTPGSRSGHRRSVYSAITLVLKKVPVRQPATRGRICKFL